MPQFSPSAPWVEPGAYLSVLNTTGYAVLSQASVCALSTCAQQDLLDLRSSWNHLPPDAYLKDGGRYRQRRHACFVVNQGTVTPVAHRAHWQPVQYNALHGGMHRMFEPMVPAVAQQPVWRPLLVWLASVASHIKGQQPWCVEVHQFRIDTIDGIGRPTPEGAHRDGVDLVAVFLVDRQNIKGGETRVFAANGPNGQRFTLTEPWSVLLLDDEKVIHESTPIQPELRHTANPDACCRDTLVVTLRAHHFQGDGP